MGGLQDPPPPFPTIHDTFTISKLPCHPCVCVQRLSIYRKPFPIENKLECKYCLESRFIPYFCRRERGKEQTKPSSFFLLVKKFPDSWTPPPPPRMKIPGSAPAASSLFCTAVSLGLFTRFSGSCRKYARGRSNLANTCMFHKRKFIY